MKFVISFLFTTTLAVASPIKLYYEGQNRYAIKLKQTLIETYFIPEELIPRDTSTTTASTLPERPRELVSAANPTPKAR